MTVFEQRPKIEDIVRQYTDCRSALRLYFAMPEADPERFATLSRHEVADQLIDRLAELELTHSLIILAAIEAMFRVDFERRLNGKKSLALSRSFRSISKEKGRYISLSDDILETWKQELLIAPAIIADIRAAMNLRHWLAHGRYWRAQLGKRYDFAGLVALADAIADSGKLLS